ncbi:MAG: MBL fold metallo-hydrolase [Firmicutes bacterium]|nr:MBL fold metallo-hydrolase [Bacillota bacterium]
MNLAICSLASGSSGNCYVVRGGDTFVLVDAGISGRQIKDRLKAIGLDPERLSAILLTHSHSDHVKGLAAILKSTDALVYANEATAADACPELPAERLQLFSTGKGFPVGSLQVQSFPVSHDTADPVGFSFLRENKQVSIVTDTGVVTQPVYDQIRGADILVLESNHDENILRMGRYPWFLKQRILGEQGHLSNEAAAKALASALAEEDALHGSIKPRTVLLAHLSRENNFPEMALATVNNILEERGLLRAGLSISALPRTEQSAVYMV